MASTSETRWLLSRPWVADSSDDADGTSNTRPENLKSNPECFGGRRQEESRGMTGRLLSCEYMDLIQ